MSAASWGMGQRGESGDVPIAAQVYDAPLWGSHLVEESSACPGHGDPADLLQFDVCARC